MLKIAEVAMKGNYVVVGLGVAVLLVAGVVGMKAYKKSQEPVPVQIVKMAPRAEEADVDEMMIIPFGGPRGMSSCHTGTCAPAGMSKRAMFSY